MTDTDDSTPYLIEAVLPILGQLDDRLDAELSEADELAVKSALTMAAIAGFVQGVAAVQFDAAKKGITLTHDLPSNLGEGADLWAKAYGDDTGAGGED